MVRLPSAHWRREGRGRSDGGGGREKRMNWGLLLVLASAASHPFYVASRGENGKDPTERKKLPDYSVRFYLLRKRTNGRLPPPPHIGLMHVDMRFKPFTMKLLTINPNDHCLDVHDGAHRKLLLRSKYLCSCWLVPENISHYNNHIKSISGCLKWSCNNILDVVYIHDKHTPLCY